jgi:hypothetical protein
MTEAVGVSEDFSTIAYAIHVYRAAGKTTEVVGMSFVLFAFVAAVFGCVWGINWVWRKIYKVKIVLKNVHKKTAFFLEKFYVK